MSKRLSDGALAKNAPLHFTIVEHFLQPRAPYAGSCAAQSILNFKLVSLSSDSEESETQLKVQNAFFSNISSSQPTNPPARLGACLCAAGLPVSSLACLLALTHLPAYLPASLPACLLASWAARLPACMPACLPACMPACLPARVPACLPACVPASHASLSAGLRCLP